MELHSAINKRFSVRSYQSKTIPKTLIEKVIDAGRLAPSAVNYQPWMFYIVTEEEYLKQLKQSYPRTWIDNVPCIIVVVGLHQQAWKRKADGKDHTDIDCSIAIDHMTLRATELGLGSCWVCNFNVPMVQNFLNLNEDEEPVALLPIGFPEEYQKAVVKKRKPIAEVAVWM